MRPATPTSTFGRQVEPSSPPVTPTSRSSNKKLGRQGIAIFRDFPSIPRSMITDSSTITPIGTGTGFSYNRFEVLDLSPRSSSPASSRQSSDSEDSVRRHSHSSQTVDRIYHSPDKVSRIRIVTEGNFTLEELSDHGSINSGAGSVIRPHQYEDAESEKAKSIRAESPWHELDDRVVNGIRDLDWQLGERTPEQERDLWLEKERQARRRKRRSSGSVQKRSLAQSIGSDTDDEDLQPSILDPNEAGSSARRLRRRYGDERSSLIFDDPPVERIEEVDEPDSQDEVVEEIVEESDNVRWERELPFYGEMEVDSSDDCKDDDDDDDVDDDGDDDSDDGDDDDDDDL